jgi:hypothetical protein
MSMPWRVSEEMLAKTNDAILKPILRDLLLAEALRAGCATSAVSINTDDRAPDGGADAVTPKPLNASDWLGDRETCWQFKIGAAGQPARLKTEVLKPLPSTTLKRQGRFVVVATSATDGEAGRRSRMNALVQAAKKKRIPVSRIAVYSTDTLARWLEQHPGIAASFMGFPAGCQQLERWKAHPHHKTPWHASPQTLQAIADYRRDLGIEGLIATPHLHISGAPGAGKTRLALEICRDAEWRFNVLYVESKGSTNVDQLLERLEASAGARAVVVVDEVDPDEARRWNGLVLRAADRLRLVTIGRKRAPAIQEILTHEVEPLVGAAMTHFIAATHPTLPKEHLEYAARFSDGFPRLALLAAAALERDRALDVQGLLARGDIRELLDELIPDHSRRSSLRVLAALESVGWTGDAAAEGMAIASHYQLDWNRVRDDIDQLHAEYGIAPTAGNLRYVSPRPLGVLLAVEAWAAQPETMRTLYDKLPTEASQRAFEERLRLISDSKQVQAFVATELRRFRSLDELSSEGAVRRWTGFGHAHPLLATRCLREALEAATVEVRRAIAGGTRRQLVWALSEHASRLDCFHDAMWALAHLAVAENETYANNATAQFVGKFQIFLGGTATPYSDRLAFIDEVIASSDAKYRALAVHALARPLETHGEHRSHGVTESLAREPEQWRPTLQELNDVLIGAFDRLLDLAMREAAPEVLDAMVQAVSRTAMRLRHDLERDRLAEIITLLARTSGARREQLWHRVEEVRSRTEKTWKDRSAADLEWLAALERQLEDPSLIGQVRRAVAAAEWDTPATAYGELAERVVADSAVWEPVWAWLTSGEARGGAWAFGEALALTDGAGLLLDAIETLRAGPDLRAVAAYVGQRARREGSGWLEDWLDRFAASHSDPNVVVELTSRTGSSSRAVVRVLQQVRAGAAPTTTEQLSYGQWADNLATADFDRLVRGLADAPAHRGSALVLVAGRAERDASYLAQAEPLALDLVADSELIRASPNHGYYWERLAEALVTRHAERIASAILAAHDPRSRGPDAWFLEHTTYARPLLERCIEVDAAATWAALKPYLEEPPLAVVYAIGLPPVLDQMPRADVLAWIGGDPKFRGALAARITAKSLEDGSLLVELLERFGHVREVADAVRSEFFSGQWWGDASAHWKQVADGLRPLANRSDKPRAARWARETIRQLEHAAERERSDEAEERIRRR